MTQDYEKLGKTHELIISANAQLQVDYECVETDDYRLAKRDFLFATNMLDRPKPSNDSLEAEKSWRKFLNAQRAFIRAQMELMHRNNVYGDVD